MKLRRWLAILLCGMLAVSVCCFAACFEENKKPGGTHNSGTLGDDDEWTDNY